MKRVILSFILLIFTLSTALGQSLTAKFESVDGYYRLTFTASSSDASQFVPPSLSGVFDVLSGPSESTFSSYQFVNGKASHQSSKSFTYILSAKQSGRVTIGSATVRIGGRTLRSRPLTAQIRAGGGSTSRHSSGSTTSHSSRSAGTGDANLQQAGSAVTGRDLFIDVTPSRRRIREQEVVLLTYRVHARAGVGLANTQLTAKPDFKGLISQEIPLPGNQIQTNIEHRGGTIYRTGTILQYVIFPQQSGPLTIPSITFDCTVIQQDHTLDLADAFFNGGGNIGVQVRRKVAPLTLQVDPLPTPKPAGFSGAVGKFSLEGRVLNPTTRTGDVLTYRLTLTGLGNLKLITPPKVNFPSDFDTYDPKTGEQTKVTANGLDGRLTFDYTFVPRNKGDYTLPPVDFVYFDTSSGAYRTLRTAPVKLHITQGTRSNEDVDRQLALLKSDIRPIHSEAFGTAALLDNLAPDRAGGLVATLLTLAVLIGLTVFIRRQGKATQSLPARKRKALKAARAQLAKAEPLLESGSADECYRLISLALTNYLCTVYDLTPAACTPDNLRIVLPSHGMASESVNLFTEVIDGCTTARFAPGGNTLRHPLFDKARQALDSIR